MVDMKRFIPMFVVLMFLSNTIIVSAWAKPCLSMDTAPSHHAAQMDDAPCHRDTNNEQKNPNQHCDGVCLCFYVSTYQTPVLNDVGRFNFTDIQRDHLFYQSERVTSTASTPPSPPPKQNS